MVFSKITLLACAVLPLLGLAAPSSGLAARIVTDPLAIACAQGPACKAVADSWDRWTQHYTGSAGLYANTAAVQLCYDESPPAGSYEGNLQKCAECVQNGTVATAIPEFFHGQSDTGYPQLCGPYVDQAYLTNWTRTMYNLGASNNFTIDLPFGTLCTGTTEGLPWPTGPATAARDLKREPLFPKPVSTSTVKTTSTSSVKKTSTSTTSATPTPSSDPVAECLASGVCVAAKRTYGVCINESTDSQVNVCFCIAGQPWNKNAAACAGCLGVTGLQADATAVITNFCASQSNGAATLESAGASLTSKYNAPASLFDFARLH